MVVVWSAVQCSSNSICVMSCHVCLFTVHISQLQYLANNHMLVDHHVATTMYYDHHSTTVINTTIYGSQSESIMMMNKGEGYDTFLFHQVVNSCLSLIDSLHIVLLQFGRVAFAIRLPYHSIPHHANTTCR
jgi:hypothetical protein